MDYSIPSAPPTLTPGLSLPLRLALIAGAGALGTLARYGVYESSARLLSRTGWHVPLATLTVNIIGSFLFGLIWAMWDRGQVSMLTRTLLLGGFMGAFTTFSSFAFDTGDLIARGNYVGAAANVLANNVLGIGAFFVGLWVVAAMGVRGE